MRVHTCHGARSLPGCSLSITRPETSCVSQDAFTDQVHELHRLVARQRRLCTVCDEPQVLNAALQAEQAQPADALQPRKRLKVPASFWGMRGGTTVHIACVYSHALALCCTLA